MKRLFYVGALSAFLLTACSGEEAKPKGDTSTTEPSESKNESVTNTPTQEELNEKMRSEAIKLDFVSANGGKIAKDTKVTITGKITNITDEGVGGKFTVTTKEGDGFGMYSVVNLTTDSNISRDSEVTVYGTFDEKDELGAPTIIATIIE